ncbi:serine hydrolase domain-containing protein [Pseudaminobacter soli (ex Li et al. 2025)]|uniref:Serine hydrolase n=1 Tax=Pseudaminobacter soli (ex Li et al. 2025) TaxID=1295366 RepID=A0A2P7SJY9_9HYPH|nr:serine hydrolase domain-containing protein [Mesorhizobium soli]PSJ62800.1 serine hydrolase [Mesorhizobium soli]
MPFLNDLSEREALASKVAAVFSERVVQEATPGARFVVFDASGAVFDSGFGSAAAAGSPPGPRARFRVASCTKSFTAAAVLLLRDRGLLSLDAPVTRYVPALQPTLPAGQPEAPTVRMLLSMAGGLPTDDPWADRQESLSNAAFHAVLRAGIRFVTAPGTRYEYSNLGYALLGQVIEVVSGQSYPDFVTDNLLKPLGLDETVFDPATVPPGMLATGFRKVDSDWQPLPFTGPGAFSAIGGVVTTTGDLARWAGWLCAAFHPNGSDSGPLSAASRREMQRIQCPIALEPTDAVRLKGYGFGLVVEHSPQFGPIISHSGGYPGFSSHMRWNPQTGFGVVAFENATYSGAWEPATKALDMLLNATTEASTSEPTPPAAIGELAAGLLRLLLEDWDDETADDVFLENVAMDRPYPERAQELASLRERAGTVNPDEASVVPTDPGGADSGFGRFELRVPCTAGEIVASVLCGPPEPMRIQSITWRL